MKKKMRRCKKCKCLFHVCTKVKKHEYCQKKECQRARKRRWQREKIKNDQQYRIDQKQAQKDWINATPEYWKEYRNNNPKYVLRNKQKQRQRNKTHRKEAPDETIAKMDALTQKNNVISGQYMLFPVNSNVVAKMDAIVVEINTISDSYRYSDP